MISIILYGRNDNYGYNLHKRAAISLNCIAEILTSSTDEILFVDYNTPDDFPTFPEAIQDTLTRAAKEKLRIFRVRPGIHERYKSKTHLVALEPIARNVAIRRSSEANRWILSTNTDMVFVLLRGRSLSELAGELPPGFYHAPRLEIPEVLWESLDRRRPNDVVNAVRAWGENLHLNEIVLGSKTILYDGPGDFQLLLRSDLFENHGFNEEMLLGWHVDSNIAARMHLKYGQVGDLGSKVYGYHCDHTRQITPAHGYGRVQNDWGRYVTDVAQSRIPSQAGSWGCIGDEIEEIRLSQTPARTYVRALRKAIGHPLDSPKIVEYAAETYNRVDYDPPHLLPFLADMFVPMPRHMNVAWYGARPQMLTLFAKVWKRLDFAGKILLDQPALAPDTASTAISSVAEQTALADADAFVFDFGGLPSSAERPSAMEQAVSSLHRSFRRAVRAERERQSSGAVPRRMIALNAINNQYESWFCGSVAAAATPFSTHMRHGFVLPLRAEESWLSQLGIDEVGVRIGNAIGNMPGKRGWIACGPYKYLDGGTYTVSLKVEILDRDNDVRLKNEPSLIVEVRAGAALLGLHLLRYGDLTSANNAFAFAVTPEIADGDESIETRIAVMAPVTVAVHKLMVKRTSALVEADLTGFAVLRLKDWLPFLRIKPIARPEEDGILVAQGESGCAIYGPYWTLPPGDYELSASAIPLTASADGSPLITVDVTTEAGQRRIAEHRWHIGHFQFSESDKPVELRLPFTLAADLPSALRMIETRVFTSGEGSFRIQSLRIQPITPNKKWDWFSYLAVGERGIHNGHEIMSISGKRGYIASSPIMPVEPGRYELSTDVVAMADQAQVGVEIWSGTELIAFGASKADQPVQFDVIEDFALRGIELRFRPPAAAVVSISGLAVERVSRSAIPGLVPPILQLDDWLPFLRTNPIAYAEGDGIVVGEGEAGYAIFGPYWTLPPGDYELTASAFSLAARPDGKPLITIDISAKAGQRQFAQGQWRIGRISFSEANAAGELRLPFTLGADLPPDLRLIETRIFTSGEGSFRVRSLVVKRIAGQLIQTRTDSNGTGLDAHNVPGGILYHVKMRLPRKLRVACATIKSILRS